MKMDEKQITQLIEESRESLKEKILESVREQVQWSVSRAINNEVGEIVSEFVKTELAPEIREHLIGSKTVIIEAATENLKPLADAVVKSFVDQITENLGTSYKRDKIIKALLD